MRCHVYALHTRELALLVPNILHFPQAYFWYAAVMIVVYPVGIPLLYATLLFNQRHVLSNKEAMGREATNGFPITGHIRFLTDPYKVMSMFILKIFINMA